jgi:cephalosporin hydroxylase
MSLETRNITPSVRLYRRVLNHPILQRLVTDAFHHIFYRGAVRDGLGDRTVWEETTWLGVTVWKNPLDLWIYQEILHEVRPDVIIETGTAHGGSALFLASMCDLLGTGTVYTIDIAHVPDRPVHDRINYVLASSTSEGAISQIRDHLHGSDRVLVILDSDHSVTHVRSELGIYSQLVTLGSYLIVEDTNVNGHPVFRGHGPGPMEAVEDFLSMDERFVADRTREKFHLTFNPRGYLRKVRA